MSDDYLAAFVELVAQFLSPDDITSYRIDGAPKVAKDQHSLHITVNQHGRDLVANTKIFAAVNAAKTYLSFKMDNFEITPDVQWGDVIVYTDFTESEPCVDRKSVRESLRLAAARRD